MKQVDGNLLFTEEKRQEYRRRVENVTPDSPRVWGTMEVDQMLHRLNLACGGSFGFYNLPGESYLASRPLFNWILVDWFLRIAAKSKLTTGERQTEECSRETALTSASLQMKNEFTSVAQYAVGQVSIMR